MFEKDNNALVLPFGKFKEIYFKFYNDIESCTSFIPKLRERNYNSTISPYEYQEKAIRAVLEAKNGVLVAPCGSGKTQMGLEIAARIGGRTLWLTHTADLLKQSMSRAQANFTLPKSEYGTITEGKVEIGNTITFATVQTMSNINLGRLMNAFDCIIVDECHHCVGSPTKLKMFYKVLTNLSARYKIGLTATPFRADGLHHEMYALLGEKIYEVPKDAVAEKVCPVKVQFIETGYKPNEDIICAGDGTLVYAKLIDDIIHDKLRNKIISGAVCMSKGSTLVLSDRIEHLNILKEDVSNCKRTAMISAANTKAAKDERNEAISKLNDHKIDVLFATYALAKEGLDIPNLRNIVFATPQKDKTTVVQSAGRVERKADGKEFGQIIDFYDDFGILKGYAKKRTGYYKKLGYEIKND